ncbi:MAG: prepilin-type N-terminal cleavage/methylation domain-containing protein [Alphaproteobacteria bacterium]|jgi:general secretion pathway protein I
MRAKRPDAGFTLVEVVVAFVVAALVMVAALRLFGGAFDGSARAERLTRALIAAESTMDSIGTAIPLEIGTQRGTVQPGLSWQATVAPYAGLSETTMGRLPVAAFAVEVRVRWADSDRDGVTLETIKVTKRAGNE